MDSSVINRFFLIFFLFFSTANAIEFQGKFLQGHFILGKTNPGAKIIVGKKEVRVSKDGFFVFGIDRDQKYLVKQEQLILNYNFLSKNL